MRRHRTHRGRYVAGVVTRVHRVILFRRLRSAADFSPNPKTP
jgi:hypothetical protein